MTKKWGKSKLENFKDCEVRWQMLFKKIIFNVFQSPIKLGWGHQQTVEGGGERRGGEVLTSEAGGDCFLHGALSCALSSGGCLGEGMKVVGCILEWALPQTQQNWGYLFTMRGHSTLSGQGLILLPTSIYILSPYHLVPHKTGYSSLPNILCWPPFPAPSYCHSGSCLSFPAKCLKG